MKTTDLEENRLKNTGKIDWKMRKNRLNTAKNSPEYQKQHILYKKDRMFDSKTKYKQKNENNIQKVQNSTNICLTTEHNEIIISI